MNSDPLTQTDSEARTRESYDEPQSNTDPGYWHGRNPVLLLTIAEREGLTEIDAAILLATIAEDVGGESHDSVILDTYMIDHVATG